MGRDKFRLGASVKRRIVCQEESSDAKRQTKTLLHRQGRKLVSKRAARLTLEHTQRGLLEVSEQALKAALEK